MSSKFLKSVQPADQYDALVKTEMQIVDSYLNINEWVKEQMFRDVLMERLQSAQRLKEKVMRFYNISSHSEVVGFRCQVCNIVFDQPTALGGHMSKSHPDFKKQQALTRLKSSSQKIRQSSIEKIKKEHEDIHLQATGIHRQCQKGISCQY